MQESLKNIALGCLLHEDTPEVSCRRADGDESGRVIQTEATAQTSPARGFSIFLPMWKKGRCAILEREPRREQPRIRTRLEQQNQTALTVFQCPSRRPAKMYVGYWPTLSTEHSSLTAVAQEGLAKSDYAANSGDSQFWDTSVSPFFEPTSYAGAATGTWTATDCKKIGLGGCPANQNCQTGVVFYRSELKRRSLVDGSSNTYLLGEKFVRTDGYEGAMRRRAFQDLRGEITSRCLWGTIGTISASRTTHWSTRTLRRIFNRNKTGPDSTTTTHSAARHPGGLNMAMCDGSVQFVSYEIDATTHRWLANRMDGNAASAP